MSFHNGGYTLNRSGLSDSASGSKRWAIAAKKAIEAGIDLPSQSRYMPGYFESDEDYEQFDSDCQGELTFLVGAETCREFMF